VSEPSLAGLRLWVTRPAGRGEHALAELREAGVVLIERPVVGFEAVDETALAAARRLWEDPRGWDWRIFPSQAPLAVMSGWVLPTRGTRADRERLAAVGAATAAAVSAALGAPCIAGPGTEGAQGLLERAEFAPARIAGARILLVQGEGGRELLETGLRERGAELAVARVYRRVALPLSLAPEHWPGGLPQALTLSSTDLTGIVSTAAREAGADWVHRLGLIAWSPRIAESARALGFSGPCECLPTDTGEEALLVACRRLYPALSP
jgi:uroporphyrinogen-III synthase